MNNAEIKIEEAQLKYKADREHIYMTSKESINNIKDNYKAEMNKCISEHINHLYELYQLTDEPKSKELLFSLYGWEVIVDYRGRL